MEPDSAKLSQCRSCAGFVPRGRPRCPNCDATITDLQWWLERSGLFLKAAGGAAVAMTMMACYGVPPPEWEEQKSKAPGEQVPPPAPDEKAKEPDAKTDDAKTDDAKAESKEDGDEKAPGDPAP